MNCYKIVINCYKNASYNWCPPRRDRSGRSQPLHMASPHPSSAVPAKQWWIHCRQKTKEYTEQVNSIQFNSMVGLGGYNYCCFSLKPQQETCASKIKSEMDIPLPSDKRQHQSSGLGTRQTNLLRERCVWLNSDMMSWNKLNFWSWCVWGVRAPLQLYALYYWTKKVTNMIKWSTTAQTSIHTSEFECLCRQTE